MTLMQCKKCKAIVYIIAPDYEEGEICVECGEEEVLIAVEVRP